MGLNINNMRSCLVRRATDQSIDDATATAISFSTSISNPNSLAEFTTNPSRITVDKEGLYAVFGEVVFAAGSTGIRTISVQRNGTASKFDLQSNQAAPASGTGKASISGLVYLYASDYVQLVVTQNNGGALNVTADTTALSPRFGVALIHPVYDPSANAESI